MPSEPTPRTSRRLLALAPAAAVFAFVAWNVLHVGFLADDYYGGEVIARHVEEHPALLDRIATTFTRRWAPDLAFWHRPLLPLSFQIDYALFGANGQIHHLTSLILWVGVAAAAAALCSRIAGPHRAMTPVVVAGLALVYPAGIEALTWLAARDDLFFAFFGLMALRARVAKPASLLAGVPWLVPALLSKETAVILVPLLNLTVLLVPSDEAGGPPLTRNRRILREALPWVAIAGWFALRYYVIGSLGSSYGPAKYFDAGDGRQHPFVAFLDRYWLFFRYSFIQAIAPANSTAVAEAALPIVGFRVAFLASSLLVIGTWLVFLRRPGDFRRALFLLSGLIAPLALLSPVYCVSPELNGSRALVFPGACWVMLVGLGFDRVCRLAGPRALAVAAAAALFLTSGLSFAIALGPYVNATIAAEGALESLRVVPPGDELVMARTHVPGLGMRSDMIVQKGAYVLSSGIYYALAPPFRQGPRVWLTIPESDAAIAALPADKPRPWLVTLPEETLSRPRFQVLAAGRSVGPSARLTPAHGSTLSTDRPLVFAFELPEGAWRTTAAASIVVVDLEGRAARAELDGRALAAASRPGGRREVPSTQLTPPIDMQELRLAGPRVLVWWVEGRDGAGATVVRSPWQAVTVPAPR